MGVNLTSELEILKQASGGAGSGVSSVTLNNGLTGTTNPITSTGTINEVRVSSCIGTEGPSASLASNLNVPLYSSSTFPNSDVDLTMRGRVGFTLLNNGTTQQRLGVTGFASGDRVQIDVDVEFTCPSGSLAILNATTPSGGPFASFAYTFTPSAPFYTCTGSAQVVNIAADERVTRNIADPATDYFAVSGQFTNFSSGSIKYSSMDVTITQYG